MDSMYGCIKIAIIASMIYCTSIQDKSLDTEMYVTQYCIVREQPNNTSEKIATYNKGEKITILTKLSNNWYMIKTNDKVGYVQSKYLEDTNKVFMDIDGIQIESVIPDNTIQVDNREIQSSIINYAYNYWYIIPENIRNNFKQNGWHILLTTKPLEEELNLDYSIIAVTLPKEKVIKIEATQSGIRKSLIHEVGHYIDYTNNYISKTKDFKEIYIEESGKLDINYGQAKFNELEYFAESFRIYISNDTEKVLIPKTIKIIENTINKMEKENTHDK